MVQNCSDSSRTWWAEAIESETKRCQAPVVCRRDLSNHFSRKGLTPLCLSAVLQDMVASQKLVPLTQSDQTWVGWLAHGAARIAMATLNLAVGNETERNTKPQVSFANAAEFVSIIAHNCASPQSPDACAGA